MDKGEESTDGQLDGRTMMEIRADHKRKIASGDPETIRLTRLAKTTASKYLTDDCNSLLGSVQRDLLDAHPDGGLAIMQKCHTLMEKLFDEIPVTKLSVMFLLLLTEAMSMAMYVEDEGDKSKHSDFLN